MTELIQLISDYSFLQHALLASVFASICCGIIGTLVVCNRLTFLAGATSHAAYGGIGISLFFGLPMLLCTIFFSFAAAIVMGWFGLNSSQKSRPSAGQEQNFDAAIGVLWAAGMAFGIILIELSPGYSGELMGFLFGSILTVPAADIVTLFAFTVLLLLLIVSMRQAFWAVSLDYDYAKSRGLPVEVISLGIIGLTAIAVVLLIRIVGLTMVLALLTIPPSFARLFCSSFYQTMIVASVLCFCFCLIGLIISWYTNISSGAVIIAVASTCFLVGCLINHFAQKYTQTKTASSAQ